MAFIIKSVKECDLIVENDYIYNMTKRNANTINWRCRIRNCGSTATTSLDYVLRIQNFYSTGEHNHEPETSLVIKLSKTYEMKQLIRFGFDSVRDVVHTVLRGADTITIRAMGEFENLYRLLRAFKVSIKNPKPYLFEEMKLSRNLSYTCTNRIFFQFGPGNYNGLHQYDDFIIFYSDTMMEKLCENRIWAMDGTFEVVPKPFYQLVTLSYLKQNHVFPVVFALLKNKRHTTYLNFFQILGQLSPLISPLMIKIDFEQAAISAIQIYFPDCQISTCQFHLGQALFRRIQKNGLQSLYNIDINVKKYTKALTALAYVRFERISEAFHELRNSASFPICLIPVYDYFYSNYIGNGNGVPRFSPSLWHHGSNVTIDIPRTNNAIEGWHSVFKSTFGCTRYSFPLLIEKLKLEEDVIRIKDLRLTVFGHLPRDAKFVTMETNIQNYLDACGESNYSIEFIFSLLSYLYYD